MRVGAYGDSQRQRRLLLPLLLAYMAFGYTFMGYGVSA
jgi:hypothetical protein